MDEMVSEIVSVKGVFTCFSLKISRISNSVHDCLQVHDMVPETIHRRHYHYMFAVNTDCSKILILIKIKNLLCWENLDLNPLKYSIFQTKISAKCVNVQDENK